MAAPVVVSASDFYKNSKSQPEFEVKGNGIGSQTFGPSDLAGFDKDNLNFDVSKISVPKHVSYKEEQKAPENIFKSFNQKLMTLNSEFNDASSDFSELNHNYMELSMPFRINKVCTLLQPASLMQKRVNALYQETVSFKYSVWQIKANPGTTELQTKAVLMDRITDLEIKFKSLKSDSDSIYATIRSECIPTIDNDNGNDDESEEGSDDSQDGNDQNGNDNQEPVKDDAYWQQMYDSALDAAEDFKDSIDNIKADMINTYCAGNEQKAKETQGAFAFGGYFVYVIQRELVVQAQNELATLGNEDMAAKFGEIVNEYDTTILNKFAEALEMEFAPELCGNADDQENQNPQDNQNPPADTPKEGEKQEEVTDQDKLDAYDKKYDKYKEDYSDLKDEFDTAIADDDEDAIKDAIDSLENLYDDVDNLYDEVADFKGNVEKDLYDDVSKLKDDIKKLKNKIKCALEGESSTYCDGSESSDASVPEADDYQPVVQPNTPSNANNQEQKAGKEDVDFIQVTGEPVPFSQEQEPTKTAPQGFKESSTYLAMLISGIVLLLGVVVFLGAVAMRL